MCPTQMCLTKPSFVILEYALKQVGPQTLDGFVLPCSEAFLFPDNQFSHDQKNMEKMQMSNYWYFGVCCALFCQRNRNSVTLHILSVSFPCNPADLFWSHKKQSQIIHHWECGWKWPRLDARLSKGCTHWNCNQTKFRIGCHCIGPTIKTKKIIECLN